MPAIHFEVRHVGSIGVVAHEDHGIEHTVPKPSSSFAAIDMSSKKVSQQKHDIVLNESYPV